MTHKRTLLVTHKKTVLRLGACLILLTLFRVGDSIALAQGIATQGTRLALELANAGASLLQSREAPISVTAVGPLTSRNAGFVRFTEYGGSPWLDTLSSDEPQAAAFTGFLPNAADASNETGGHSVDVGANNIPASFRPTAGAYQPRVGDSDADVGEWNVPSTMSIPDPDTFAPNLLSSACATGSEADPLDLCTRAEAPPTHVAGRTGESGLEEMAIPATSKDMTLAKVASIEMLKQGGAEALLALDSAGAQGGAPADAAQALGLLALAADAGDAAEAAVSSIPEPGTLLLFGAALSGLIGRHLRAR